MGAFSCNLKSCFSEVTCKIHGTRPKRSFKTPGIGPSCSIPLEHASSQAAAVTSAKKFSTFQCTTVEALPLLLSRSRFFPSPLCYFSPPYNLVDRTEEKTQLRAEGCHNNFVMACDTYLKQALPRPPSPSRPDIRRHDGAQNKKIPGCSGDDPERGT